MKQLIQSHTQQTIVKTAEGLLQKKGVETLTIRELAKTLGCSVGSVYTYFADKETILKEIYVGACKDLWKELQALSRTKNLENDFVQFVAAICDFRIRNSYRYREIYQKKLINEEPEELMKIRKYLLERLSELKLRALSKPKDIKKAGRILVALCEGIATLAIMGQSEVHDTAATVEFAVRSLIAGWKN